MVVGVTLISVVIPFPAMFRHGHERRRGVAASVRVRDRGGQHSKKLELDHGAWSSSHNGMWKCHRPDRKELKEVMAELIFVAERCMGNALCHATAPEVYELNRSGHLLAPPRMNVDPSLRRAAQIGAEACPERAIAIVDDGVAAFR
jgi:ferredoxin